MTTPAITKHLNVLERAGLISRSRQAQWRTCQLNAGPLHEVADFIEQYRLFWEQRFDQLDAYLKTLNTPNTRKSKEKKNGRKKC